MMGTDGIAEFGERACARGSLGVLPAKDVMRSRVGHHGLRRGHRAGHGHGRLGMAA